MEVKIPQLIWKKDLKNQFFLQINDAYEEIDEQRQVVAQWKRKTQKVTGELNDTKLLLEEQTSRNTLLEKKQRKFDNELGMLNEDKKQESNQREKLQREVDALKAQKYGLEEQIHVSSTHFLLLICNQGKIFAGCGNFTVLSISDRNMGGKWSVYENLCSREGLSWTHCNFDMSVLLLRT